MSIFNLPDLGEGLPDAEIHEWFVKEGDTVKADQPLVSVETAKAVVEVPCPQDGIIIKLFGKAGDIINTGEPLVEFEAQEGARPDQGTVVGKLEESNGSYEDRIIEPPIHAFSSKIKATPRVRTLARKFGVDLTLIKGTGDHGYITVQDVEGAASAAGVNVAESAQSNATGQNKSLPSNLSEGYVPLKGVRRAMCNSMAESHKEVVPVSIYEEVDINLWAGQADITVKIIRAILQACEEEPALNAWFDSDHKACKRFQEVNLGLAMDSEEGLFVPVIHQAKEKTDAELRNIIDRYKKEVSDRLISPDNFKGATITLSNFGKFAGLFASPIIVPPMVAILAVGRLYERVVSHQEKFEAHSFLPLSLSFDHRAVTGGEATRFLGAVKKALQKY